MKKTILFLMNGFGIEQSTSYNVYNSKIMPNLDRYTKDYLFSSIETSAYEQDAGYRLFSTGSNYSLSYTLIDNYMDKLSSNPNMNFYLDSIKDDAKIQLFLFLENEKSLNHLKEMIKFIRTKKQNPIFLHFVLTGIDTNNYKDIERVVNKVSYDYKDCKIATIIGLNSLKAMNLNTYMNLLQNEVGEKWREVSRKLTSLTTAKTEPRDVKEFYMNEEFKLNTNDSFFFFNYDYADLSGFVNNISKVTNHDIYYSLFPIKGIKYPMFGYPTSGISMANALKKIGAKALIITDTNNVKMINYYCSGLQNVNSDNIAYTSIEDVLSSKEKVSNIVNSYNYDLIIFDYRIDGAKTVNELSKNLSRLDNILGFIHDICVDKKISLFISSLYGMKKEMSVDNYIKAYVDFSTKLPFIVIDPVFKKTNFRLDFGNVYNMAHTIYTNINKDYIGGAVLIKKKGYLTKILKK